MIVLLNLVGIVKVDFLSKILNDCFIQKFSQCASSSVFRWEMEGGIIPAKKYPYQDKDGQCSYNKKDVIAYVDLPFDYDFYNVDHGDEYMK